MAGLYIHIPFCASRCSYCGFYSTTLLHLQDRYTNALCREMEMRSKELKTSNENMETIYLGGGTPSQLSSVNLQKLFQYIYKVYGNSSFFQEVTMECNPDDLSAEYIAMLSQFPINRISMGVQTFSDNRLQFLHRRHTTADVHSAVNHLHSAGFHNISIDLMFGFPDETLADWQHDIDEALVLDVKHISAYSLMYEEGTVLYEQCKKSKIKKLNEETERQMYEILIDCLESAGYEHYEISNFAKTSQANGEWRGHHNSNYWNGTHYIGIGAAAHSYDGNMRQWNVSNIHTYIQSIEQGIIPCEQEELNDDTHYNDLVTTALRTKEGICLSTLAPKYHDYLLSNAQPSLHNGLLRIDNGSIHLTRSGLFVSDDVMSDLIWI